ncbi:PAS domain-containing sensor histidine kinase [Natronogracilivirga saccharolytica]|uniref:histidine kinase n=1 Tax=Natronogracilivirga saccharolytica TaxID=2812953 RepID=A0A8J7RTJ8_9BACT|nr:PAS domain S-box protein [Natronogracilivirga saccharolytica]MBP3192732.1 PAS domain S-box protein [Natronogracilivirga saccharolytica]
MKSGSHTTILLVETQEQSERNFHRELTEHGYDVLTCASDTDAEQAAGELPDDSLVLFLLPSRITEAVDALFRTAAEIGQTHDLPVVFLTGRTDPQTLEKIQAASPYCFIKPDESIHEISACLSLTMQHHGRHRQLRSELERNKKLQREIQESSEKYHRLFHTITQGVIYQNPDGTISSANPAAGKILGLSADQMKGKTSMDPRWKMIREDGSKVPGSEHPAMIALRTGKKTGPVTRGVYIPEQNRYTWLKITAIPLFKPGADKPFQAYATFEDITTRKRSDEKLRKREQRLRHSHDLMQYIIEHNRSAVAVHDKDLNYVYVSQRYLDVFKVKDRAIIGKHHYEVFPDLPEKWRKVHQKALQGHTSSAENDPFYRSDGTVEWTRWECRPWYEMDGSIGGIIIYTEVITDRKKEEERFRQIIELNQTVIWELDTNGLFTFISPMAEKIWGHKPEEGREAFREETLTRIRAGNTFQDHLNPVQRPDGSIAWVLTNAMPIYDDRGNLLGYRGSDQDVTELKMAEEQVCQSLKEKEVLLSEIHHRVKNNMAVISSLLTLQSEFSSQKKNPDKLIQSLQTRVASMGLVHELVYESSNFAEIEAGELLRRLVEYLDTIYEPDEKKITVKVWSDDIMLTMNESVPMTLFISELVTNAYKHAFRGCKGGNIDVVFEKFKEGRRLVIRDNGKGVPDVDTLNNPESFGYTIIHGLIQQLRGELMFSTPPEGGLTVEARLPDKKSGSNKRSKRSKGSSTGSSKKSSGTAS